MIELVRRHSGAHPALLDPSRRVTLSYAELMARVDDCAGRLAEGATGRPLVFLSMGSDADAVVLYLACLAARLPVCLAEAQVEPLSRLTAAYSPSVLLLPATVAAPPGYRRDEPLESMPGYRLWTREQKAPLTPHPDLALLLTTSGSTGNPKLVRLTLENLESNARAIVEYLGIGPGERAVQSLPSHYSYGLSVLNSHLIAGGTVVMTPHSFMRPEFWSVVDELACTSFAGVPYMYETLHRLRFQPARHSSLRTMTQAGGGLRPDLITHYHGLASTAGIRLFIMYGQTEATARISYVPPDRLGEKIGSIGIPIQGGRLGLAPVEDLEASELVYAGPNVMMGYAERPEDLALGDAQNGTLRTGDLGRVDDDGFFYVTGRLKRFAKLFGHRVSLEDIERELETRFAVRAAALDGGDRILLHVVIEDAADPGALAAHVARYLGVPPPAVHVRRADSLPLTAAGKKDYRALERLAQVER